MKVEDVVLKRAKYKMKSFRINIPGREAYEVDKSLMGSIKIEKDFDNYIFPYFTVEVVVPNSVARQMRKNNTDLTVTMDIQMGLFELDDDEKNVNWGNGISGTYYVLLVDDDPDLNQELQEKFEKMQGTYGNDGMGLNDYTIYQLLLYNKDTLFKVQTITNKVITSVNLITALAYTLNSAGIGNCLVSPPSNYKSYREFKLVPVTAKEQLERICNGYGMHKKGTMIFFDIDRNYILEKTNKCTAWTTNEITKVYLANFSKEFPNSTAKVGCYTNTKEKYYLCNIMENSVNTKSSSLVSTAVNGSNVIHIDEVAGSSKTVSAKSKSSKFAIGGPTRVVSTAVGDDTSASLAARTSEASNVMTVNLEYVDLKMLKPNKEYIFSTDDSKKSRFNGTYRMTKCTIELNREGKYLIPRVELEIKK